MENTLLLSPFPSQPPPTKEAFEPQFLQLLPAPGDGDHSAEPEPGGRWGEVPAGLALDWAGRTAGTLGCLSWRTCRHGSRGMLQPGGCVVAGEREDSQCLDSCTRSERKIVQRGGACCS